MPERQVVDVRLEPVREADGEVAGLTMTCAVDSGTRAVAEFFVVRRWRRQGAGGAAARQMLARRPGAEARRVRRRQ